MKTAKGLCPSLLPSTSARWRHRGGALWLTALLWGVAPGTLPESAARAESAAPTSAKTDAARKHFDAGKRHYQAGAYAAAIEQFRLAQAIHSSPILEYNIALCYDRLGQPQEAVAFYRSYLRGSPNADNRTQTEARIRQLEAAPRGSQVAGSDGQGRPTTPPDGRGAATPTSSGRPPASATGTAGGQPTSEPPRTDLPPPTFVFPAAAPAAPQPPAGGPPPPGYDLQTPWYARGAQAAIPYGPVARPLRRVALSVALNASTNLTLNDVSALSGRVEDVGVGAAFALSILALPSPRLGVRLHASTAVFGQTGGFTSSGTTTATFVGAGAYMELPLAHGFPLYIAPMAAVGLGVLGFTGELGDRIAGLGGTRSYLSAAMRFEVAIKYVVNDRHGFFLTPVGLNVFFAPSNEGPSANSQLGFDQDNYLYDVLVGYELRL